MTGRTSFTQMPMLYDVSTGSLTQAGAFAKIFSVE